MRDVSLEEVIRATDVEVLPLHQKIMVIGHMPSSNPHPDSDGALFPWPRSSAGYRLWKWSGMSIGKWFQRVDRMNTIPHVREGVDPLFMASEHAESVQRDCELGKHVCIFVGKDNASLYSWPDKVMPSSPMKWVATEDGGTWTWIPHTSGRVLYWNDGFNRLRLKSLFSEARSMTE